MQHLKVEKNSKGKNTIQDRRMYNLEDWLTESN